MTSNNTKLEKLIEMLQSPTASIRYEACEYLRIAPELTPEAINALHNSLSDPDADVAEAAQRAIALHAPKAEPDANKLEDQNQMTDEPPSNIKWSIIKAGSGTIVAIIVTIIAGSYFESGCTNSNYMGNLFFIFIVTWIVWMVISSLMRGKDQYANLGGMLLSLFVILLGAFPCITLIGFWVAPVCN